MRGAEVGVGRKGRSKGRGGQSGGAGLGAQAGWGTMGDHWYAMWGARGRGERLGDPERGCAVDRGLLSERNGSWGARARGGVEVMGAKGCWKGPAGTDRISWRDWEVESSVRDTRP